MTKDKNGNPNCNECNNNTWGLNSLWCNNSTWCYNSIRCKNCTKCDNSAYLLYCCDMILEKFRIFNKKVTKREFERTSDKIHSYLGHWKPSEQLTKEDISWLKKNVKQFDIKVLNKIIEDSRI